MKFSLTPQKSNNAPPTRKHRKEVVHKEDQRGVTFNAGLVKLNHSPISGNTTTSASQIKWATASIAWATASIAWAIAVSSIVWAVFVYLMERERRHAQVELARLEMEGKKQLPPSP